MSANELLAALNGLTAKVDAFAANSSCACAVDHAAIQVHVEAQGERIARLERRQLIAFWAGIVVGFLAGLGVGLAAV